MSFSISGKTAIVTGAANGIGLAIARQFAEQGANVMFADVDEDRLAKEIGDSDTSETSNIRSFAGDLRQKLAQANLLSATIDAFDRVDILVNANRQIQTTDALSAEDNSLSDLLTQNLVTSYRLSQVIARRMLSQAKHDEEHEGAIGSIINISSIAAHRAAPDLLAYAVSAAALDQLTRSHALALAPHRIRVNAVAFGSVMSASLQNELREDPNARDIIAEKTPLGRIASSGELADAVQFLASEASAFMTGQIVTVDGGRSLMDAVESSAH